MEYSKGCLIILHLQGRTSNLACVPLVDWYVHFFEIWHWPSFERLCVGHQWGTETTALMSLGIIRINISILRNLDRFGDEAWDRSSFEWRYLWFWW